MIPFLIDESTVNLISNVGFPIFVAAYLMFTMNKSLKHLTEAIKELKMEIRGKNGRK